MQTRREMLVRSATVASLMAGAGLLPNAAHAAWNEAAFAAKTLADVAKAFGGTAPVESKDVMIEGPDIAENGAVVPVGASSTLPGVKRLMLLVEKNPSVLAATFDVTDTVRSRAVFFGAVGKIESLPAQVPEGATTVVLDMHRLVSLDNSGLDALEHLYRTLKKRGVALVVAQVNEQPLSLVRRSGFDTELGPDGVAASVDAAMAGAQTGTAISAAGAAA